MSRRAGLPGAALPLALFLVLFLALPADGAAQPGAPRPAPAGDARAVGAVTLTPCRLPGVEHEARCGGIERPLDPANPASPRITVRFALLPALARRPAPDPVVFFAGGPGQGAVALAGRVQGLLGRLGTRRDILLVDLRGTGDSAPLRCTAADGLGDDALRPLAEAADAARVQAALAACRDRLAKLPHGDLSKYTTALAAGDVDAVRAALGIARLNLVGGSYGTRVALEVLRQHPQAVRRVVLDGVAPPDMVLPVAAGLDAAAAFDALAAACSAEPACAARHGDLRGRLAALAATLPREVRVRHPVTGAPERFVLTAEALAAMVRTPLYAPGLAAGLPAALAMAADGDWAPLAALASALGGGGAAATFAQALHFSVICAEDAPGAADTANDTANDTAAASRAAARSAPGGTGHPGGAGGTGGVPAAAGLAGSTGGGAAAVDGAAFWGPALAEPYRRVCAGWPRGTPPAGFRSVPPSTVPVLLLSGGADPVTPPRHAARVAAALGPAARSVVVDAAGHGTLALPCVRDAVLRFIDAADDGAARALRVDCPAALPRPPAFVPAGAGPVPAAPSEGVPTRVLR